MNTQLETFHLKVNGNQVVEAVASIFHTVLFHRCLSKFYYNPDGSYYSKGVVGYMEVDCDFLDLTYIACSSNTLNKNLKETIINFSNELRGSDGQALSTGQIALEFFEKKKRPVWQFYPYPGVIPWEIWNINIELTKQKNEQQTREFTEELSNILMEKLQLVTQILNSSRYLPDMPKEVDLDCVFDTSYPDINPYNFRVSYEAQNCRSLLKDTIRQFFYRNVLN